MGVRENQGANIGDYLFKMSREVNFESKSSFQQPKINDISASMVKEMQFRRISWLFS